MGAMSLPIEIQKTIEKVKKETEAEQMEREREYLNRLSPVQETKKERKVMIIINSYYDRLFRFIYYIILYYYINSFIAFSSNNSCISQIALFIHA